MIWSVVFFKYELCLLAVLVFLFSIWLTVSLNFVQVRCFRLAWITLFEKINKAVDMGEISQAQALTLGLSGTVGVANIAIVSFCIVLAGPGTIFWLILSAFLGMSIKFSEATLGQKYRYIQHHQFYIGGPMVTLSRLFQEQPNLKSRNNFITLKKISRFVGILYALTLLCMVIILGNLFQVNQIINIFNQHNLFNFNYSFSMPIILIIAMVMLAWNGKFNRLAYFLARVIPFIITLYLVISLSITLLYFDRVLDILVLIVRSAFSSNQSWESNAFIFVVGVLLGMVSHESGLGISAIAHASAKTHSPVKQGLVAMLEPFIDTILVCFLTAMVLLIAMDQGFKPNDYLAVNIKLAFIYLIPWTGILFNVIMLMLAISCLISCYFYVGKLMQYLFNVRLSIMTLFLYCVLIYLSAELDLAKLSSIILYLLPFVIIPNLFTIGMNIRNLKHDLVIYQSCLDDGLSN